MNNEPEAVILSDRKLLNSLQKKFLFSSLGLLIFIGIIYFFYSNTRLQESGDSSVVIINSDILVDKNLYGSLFFNAKGIEASSTEQQLYRYDFAEERVSAYVQDIMQKKDMKKRVQWIGREYFASSSSRPRIMVVDNTDRSSVFLSGDDVVNEADLNVSPDINYAAYSYQTVEGQKGAYADINNWNVAIHALQTGEVQIFKSAARPIFYRDGAYLLFMRLDGIYEYNLATKEQYLVYKIGTLTYFDKYAVSADSSYLLITQQNLKQVSVVQYTGSTSTIFSVTSTIKEPGVTFSNPVISEDSHYFAVVAVDSSGTESIEIKSIENGQTLSSLTDKLSGLSEVDLQEWSLSSYAE